MYIHSGYSCSGGVARVYFFTESLAEFQHVNCMIVRICEVRGVACYAQAEGSCLGCLSCSYLTVFRLILPMHDIIIILKVILGTLRLASSWHSDYSPAKTSNCRAIYEFLIYATQFYKSRKFTKCARQEY